MTIKLLLILKLEHGFIFIILLYTYMCVLLIIVEKPWSKLDFEKMHKLVMKIFQTFKYAQD